METSCCQERYLVVGRQHLRARGRARGWGRGQRLLLPLAGAGPVPRFGGHLARLPQQQHAGAARPQCWHVRAPHPLRPTKVTRHRGVRKKRLCTCMGERASSKREYLRREGGLRRLRQRAQKLAPATTGVPVRPGRPQVQKVLEGVGVGLRLLVGVGLVGRLRQAWNT